MSTGVNLSSSAKDLGWEAADLALGFKELHGHIDPEPDEAMVAETVLLETIGLLTTVVWSRMELTRP